MLGFSTQVMDILKRVKGYKKEERIGASFVSGKAHRTGTVHPRADKVQRDLIHICSKGKCRDGT